MALFKEFINAGAFGNTATTGFDSQTFGTGHSLNLPTPTLDIPTKIVNGTIQRISYNTNPIAVYFDNGTKWQLTKQQWDYMKSIGKEPREKARMQIEMFLDGTIKAVNAI